MLQPSVKFFRWPSSSPDGKLIAFQSNRDGNAEIYTMRANGTLQTNRSQASWTSAVACSVWPGFSWASFAFSSARCDSPWSTRIFTAVWFSRTVVKIFEREVGTVLVTELVVLAVGMVQAEGVQKGTSGPGDSCPASCYAPISCEQRLERLHGGINGHIDMIFANKLQEAGQTHPVPHRAAHLRE